MGFDAQDFYVHLEERELFCKRYFTYRTIACFLEFLEQIIKSNNLCGWTELTLFLTLDNVFVFLIFTPAFYFIYVGTHLVPRNCLQYRKLSPLNIQTEGSRD